MKKNLMIKISSIYFLVESVINWILVIMVALISMLAVAKEAPIRSGDPIGFVLEEGSVAALFLLTGILGLRTKAFKVQAVLGAACGICGIYQLISSMTDPWGIIMNVLMVAAAVIYICGAWKMQKS